VLSGVCAVLTLYWVLSRGSLWKCWMCTAICACYVEAVCLLSLQALQESVVVGVMVGAAAALTPHRNCHGLTHGT
jgi:hypothetical protein